MDPIVTLELVVQLALADARRLGAGQPQVLSAARVVWPDGAIGCPRPGMAYSQALVPGYHVVVQLDGQQLSYHATRQGRPVLCPADRVRPPLPDAAI